MPNDSKPPLNPWDKLLEITQKLTDSLATIRCSLDAIKTGIDRINQQPAQSSPCLAEPVGQRIRENCQRALQEFTQFKGAVGLLKWFVKETQQKPWQMLLVYAMMASTVLLLAALGLDVSKILNSLLQGTGITS